MSLDEPRFQGTAFLRQREGRSIAGLVVLAAVLAGTCLASVAVGSRPIPPLDIVQALYAFDPANNDHQAVVTLRLPRTGVGILAGACLGLAGAIMQGAVRNPLADPGLLGVNAGAALSVVVAIALFGITSLSAYVWFAFAGAALAAALVLAIASGGRDGPTPIKLTLSGVVVSAFLASLTTIALVTNQATLDQFRFWQVGALSGRDTGIFLQALPFALAAVLLALLCAGWLNSLSLGDTVAKGLGTNVTRARLFCGLAVVALAGTATAMVGPISFIGLIAPHLMRAVVGSDYRWLLPYSALGSPVLLLSADIAGRVMLPYGEVQVGIIMAILGAPVFVALVRLKRMAVL